MATFVLVHGGCHGGWCYSRVATRLRAHGHDVYSPTLTGLSDRAHLAGQSINLKTHVDDVVGVMNSYDLDDVILCGHSYGGMVITGVAGQVGERIKALFYLDAAVPEDGQSLFDIVGPTRTLAMLQAAGESGTMMVSPGAEFFQVNADDVTWVDHMCTPHPVGCFIQKLRYTGKESLVTHRTFVLCKKYQSANYDAFAKVKDLPAWKAVSLDSGHDVMVDDPDALAALLLEELQR
jgi:pimeloyl-ACP methyl ester carboxylesterase